MKQSVLAIDYIDRKNDQSFHLPITDFCKPRNERDYKRLAKILDKLIDLVKENEQHPLAVAMQIIGNNLEQYDDETHAAIGEGLSDVEKVSHLMSTYDLTQTDLASIFGGQANVSKFLHGERKLSKKHIQGLKQYFQISADYFL